MSVYVEAVTLVDGSCSLRSFSKATAEYIVEKSLVKLKIFEVLR
jgi:hypothetical protein